VKTTILLVSFKIMNGFNIQCIQADMNDFTTVNDIYKEYFKAPFPARAAYQVATLPKDARVEIEAVAVLGHIKDA
jgi:enamine deaminase RidA (YjgF/YER057c/UK114 family)